MLKAFLIRAATPLALCCTLTAADGITSWLGQHRDYRLATDADCDCKESLARFRKGYGGRWLPAPAYQPYAATGDFNGDGIPDRAYVVIHKSHSADGFALLIFNGPTGSASPAFMEEGMRLQGSGLFFGPPRPKPYRLVVGPFEAEGLLLEPKGKSYELTDPDAN